MKNKAMSQGKKKTKKKMKLPDHYCRNCVWLINKEVCFFRRCVKKDGFIDDARGDDNI